MTDTASGSIRTQRLAAFVEWARQHITGDEKGEVQIFLDHLFQAFGQSGLKEAGGTAEYSIKKGKDETGGTSFADYVLAFNLQVAADIDAGNKVTPPGVPATYGDAAILITSDSIQP